MVPYGSDCVEEYNFWKRFNFERVKMNPTRL